MFERQAIYLFADTRFFEDVTRWQDGPGMLENAELSVSRRPVPAGWRASERHYWCLRAPSGRQLPEQGWKVHVSATLDSADEVCTTVWDYCVSRDIAFKYLRDRNMLLALNSKYAPRNASGKFITIYPEDLGRLGDVIDELGPMLAGRPGPYILSDLRIGDGPLFVRYGAFREMRCLAQDGELVGAVRRPDGVLVPDERTAVFRPPAWVPMPDLLRPHAEARRQGGDAHQPYRVRKALHFSNAGGVYAGTRVDDGTPVVLKEGRPFAGLDNNHEDGATRLTRERWALERLRGLDGVPALLDAFTAGGHHFVVEEFVEGQPLHEWIGCHHPWIVEDRPTPADLAEFTERVTELHSRLEHILDGIHARGVVFGDLHLGNIIVRPDGTPCLIDFELAFPVEEADRVPGLAAVGFACLDKRGVELDRYALAAVRLGTYLWLNRVCALHPGKLPRYVEAVTGAFPVPAEWGPGVTSELSDGSARSWTSEYEFPPGADLGDAAVDWPVARRSMADAMALSATPAREDRLFPGDLRQFTGGALNLATGAAGVLWVLSTAAHVRYAEYEDWLRAAVRRTEYLAPGLYSGAAGIAYLLDELGWAEDAAGVLDRHGAGPDAPVGADLFGGLAGMGLARLDRARRHGEAESRQAALGIADRIADGLGGAPRPAGTTTLSGVGLLRGWSGVALFLLRLAEDVADRDLVSLAIRAVHRDLDRCVPTRDGSLHVDEPGRRTLAYLDGGSAGIALAIDELLDHRPDERCLQELPLLLRACLPQFMFQGNLGRGRAGLLATLARTTGRAALPAAVHLQAIERHLGRLDWHAVPYRGNVAFVGDQNLRISMDLETGGAGVLLAVATATQSGAGFLPFFSRRPAPCAPEARTHPEATRSHQSPILRR